MKSSISEFERHWGSETGTPMDPAIQAAVENRVAAAAQIQALAASGQLTAAGNAIHAGDTNNGGFSADTTCTLPPQKPSRKHYWLRVNKANEMVVQTYFSDPVDRTRAAALLFATGIDYTQVKMYETIGEGP